MADEDDVGEVTLAVERLIDQCGKALDGGADLGDNSQAAPLQEAFDDLMEKMRRAAR